MGGKVFWRGNAQAGQAKAGRATRPVVPRQRAHFFGGNLVMTGSSSPTLDWGSLLECCITGSFQEMNRLDGNKRVYDGRNPRISTATSHVR